MKRIACLLVLALYVCALAGCGLQVPRPSVKEGRFNFSVTYEQNGEQITVSDVYVCEYAGIGWHLDGGSYYRYWTGHFEKGMDGDVMALCETGDGGKIYLVFLIYPEYFMGEPDYAVDYTPTVRLSLIYESDEEGEGTMICEDEAVIAGYGFKLIDFTYDAPIENTFVSLY